MLAEALAGEVAESERRLSEEDRRLFEEFVTGGLAEHLHQRIGEARETVARMNDEIARVQASSGMSIEVRWQRAETPARHDRGGRSSSCRHRRLG